MNFYEDEFPEPDEFPYGFGRILLYMARSHGKTLVQQQALSQSIHSTHVHTFDLNQAIHSAPFARFRKRYVEMGNHLHVSIEKIGKLFGDVVKAMEPPKDPRSDHPAVRGRYLPQPHSMARSNSQQYLRKGRRK